MTELLVQPMRREQAALVNTIFALGATYPHLELLLQWNGSRFTPLPRAPVRP